MTDVVWAPVPMNLAWSTGAPLVSFLAWPLTATFGPVAAFNVLCLIAPPLAAWTAFLLCRYVSGSVGPALLGGYIFGFSPFMLGHQIWGHTDLTMVFLIPLAVYLVLLRLDRQISGRQLTLWLTLLLSAQFMIAIEVFATMAVFGAMAIILGWAFADDETGRRLARCVMPIALAYVLSLCVVSPYLYYMFAFGHPAGAIWSQADSSADLLNFLIPTPVNALGVIPCFERISSGFCESMMGEATAYLGIPLILLAGRFAQLHWREPLGKLLIDLLVILCVLSMGPVLKVSDVPVIGLPGKLFASLPLLDKTLPGRFSLYVFLDLALIISPWFASTTLSKSAKAAVAGAIVAFQLPNLSGAFWVRPIDTPGLFSGGLYQRYIKPNEIVVALPYSFRGNSMIWQARSGMYFRMARGTTGTIPEEYASWPIFEAFIDRVYLPDAAMQLEAFMAGHQSSTLIVDDNDPNRDQWISILTAARAARMHVGGVSIFDLARSDLDKYRGIKPSELDSQAALQVFGTLVDAAETFLTRGGDPRSLCPAEVERMGLLPGSWLIGYAPLPPNVDSAPQHVSEKDESAEPHFRAGVWLGVVKGGLVGVGLVGRYVTFKAVVQKYGKLADKVYLPYPQDLRTKAKTLDADQRTLLLMLFDRSRLGAVARRDEQSRATIRSRQIGLAD
jgi:hypothetical protein